MRCLLRTAAIAVVLFLLLAGGFYAYVEKTATTPKATDEAPSIEFNVPRGATLTQVGRMLQEARIIKSSLVWRIYVRIHNSAPPKAGRHTIHAGMNVPDLVRALSGMPLSDDVPLTLVEGWRLMDGDEWLTRAKLIEPGTYLRAARNPSQFKISFPFEAADLEGYLFPETYLVPPGPLEVDRLIQRQIDAFAERFFRPNAQAIAASGRSLHEIVTMASLLEREEPNPSERATVAGVLFKRLDARTPLGVDATSRFRLSDWNDRRAFLEALRDPAEPYNTRLRVGLPPGPIGAPGIESLAAALRPEKSPYWYYLHDSDRRIHFSRTSEEHEANRRRYNVY